MDRGGNLIIPSFAVGRTQTMLYYLFKLWKANRIEDYSVVVDSPLAVEATRNFAKNTKILLMMKQLNILENMVNYHRCHSCVFVKVQMNLRP